MTSTALAIVRDDVDITLFADPGAYVVVACERAKEWLVDALTHGDVERIVDIRCQAESIRVYTQQKELGKGAELAAAEIVRRAERGIHLAVATARERGEILRIGQTSRRPGHHVGDANVVKTLTDVGVSRGDLASTNALVKGVTDEQFEDATQEARAEKDLSRANLIRKIRAAENPATPLSRRLDEIAELARDAVSSRQMAEKFGHSAEHVRKLARANGIDIPADRIVGKTHRIDPERVLRESVHTLQGVESSLALLRPEDYDAFRVEQLKDWLTAVKEPARAVRDLVRELNHRVRNTANTARYEEGRTSGPSSLDPDRQDEGVPTGPA